LHWPWKDSNGRYASGAEFERVAGIGSSGIGREPIGKFASGFWHTWGEFSSAYRAAFGETPARNS